MKYNTIARPTTSSKLDLIIHICTQRLGQYIVADMRVSHSLRVAVIWENGQISCGSYKPFEWVTEEA